jgi:F0F1-type ATP synthase membrane subunit b/b'
LLRYAVINVTMYDFNAFESDGLFLFGRLMLMFLVYWFISKFVLSRLQNWLYKASEPKSWQRR